MTGARLHAVDRRSHTIGVTDHQVAAVWNPLELMPADAAGLNIHSPQPQGQHTIEWITQPELATQTREQGGAQAVHSAVS
jgi:hypothetical protein